MADQQLDPAFKPDFDPAFIPDKAPALDPAFKVDNAEHPILAAVNGSDKKSFLSNHPLIKRFIEQRIPQMAGQQPGVLNSDPSQNPLMGKSWLPETQADPGIIGAAKHWGYENIVRPLASPLGLIGALLDASPMEHPSLGSISSELPKQPLGLPPPSARFIAGAEGTLDTGVASLQSATKEATTASIAGKPFDARLADWYNGREASKVAGIRNKNLFQHLDTQEPYSDILSYQANPSAPKYSALRNYFSGKRQELIQSGLQLGDKGDAYLPQLWKETPEEIRAKLSGKAIPPDSSFQEIVNPRLGIKPSFSFESVIADYKLGRQLGLTPQFENLSDLAGWYEKTANKNLADRQFFNTLVENKEISTVRTAGEKAIDPNIMPSIAGKDANKVFYANPEVATKIENVLRQPDQLLQRTQQVTGTLKNLQMSVGVPGTAISPHGVSTLVRGALADPSMVPGLIRDMVTPSHSLNTIDAAIADGRLEKFMKAGMTFSSEEHNFSSLMNKGEELGQTKLTNILDSVQKAKDNLFERPVFGRLIPAAKINIADKLEKQFIQAGVPPETATNEAAHAANTIFGGINIRELGRNPNFQAALRTLFFAPDYAESNIKISANMVKGLMNPSNPLGAPYRKMAFNLAALYTGANLLNKELSGHYMFENDPQHSFDLETGHVDSTGRKQIVRLFGSAAEVPRLTSEAISAIISNHAEQIPNIIGNRLSPTANLGIDLTKNADFAGRPILGATKYNKPQTTQQQLLNLGRVIADRTLPRTPGVISDLTQDKISPEAAISAGLGLPVSYYRADQPLMRILP